MRVFNLDADINNVSSTTSKGNQIKWIYNDNGKLIYIKADMFGYESIAEVLVSELLHYVEDIDFVDYYICETNYKGKHYFGCYSYNMLKDNQSLISVYRVLDSCVRDQEWVHLNGKDFLNYVINTIQKYCCVDITVDLQKMINLDAITLNEDRHLNNMCLIYDVKEHKYIGMSPIFDNGASLLSDINDYMLIGKISRLMMDVRSKPFSTSFKKQVNYFSPNPLRIHLNEFISKLDSLSLEDERMSKILHRARTVMRRSLLNTEGLAWVKI